MTGQKRSLNFAFQSWKWEFISSYEFVVFPTLEYLTELFFINSYYRPQRSWGKVIFSQACVILFTGGGSASVHAGIPPRSRNPPQEQAPPGPGTPQSRQPPGAGTPLGRRHPPPGKEHARRYGQRAGGTHPTGMQFCFSLTPLFINDFSLNHCIYTYVDSVLIVKKSAWIVFTLLFTFLGYSEGYNAFIWSIQIYPLSTYLSSWSCTRVKKYLQVNLGSKQHIQCYDSSGGSRGEERPPPPPPGFKFFQFYAVFGKFWQNHMFAVPEGWRPHFRIILNPPLDRQ